MNGIRVAAVLACAAAVWVVWPILRALRREKVPGVGGSPGLSSADAAAELAVQRWREREASCPKCGPRPESEALYCSACGQELVD